MITDLSKRSKNLYTEEESAGFSAMNSGSNGQAKTSDSRKRSSEATNLTFTKSKGSSSCDYKSKNSIDPQNIAPAPYFHYTNRSREIDEDPLTPLAPPYRIPSFLIKLFCILSRDDLRHIIKWLPHGRSWRIIDPVEFEMSVIPTYFGHSNMNSFLRQVNGWGFKRMTQGRNKNSYYNEYFLRGLPHLCKRAPRPGNISSLNVDSKYEPELFAISDEHPVPEEIDTLVPCGASVVIIDNCIKEQGPKGRVPLIQSLLQADEAESVTTHQLSGRAQMGHFDNHSYASSGRRPKRMKYSQSPGIRINIAETASSPRPSPASDCPLENAGLFASLTNQKHPMEICNAFSTPFAPMNHAGGNNISSVASDDVIGEPIPVASSDFHQNAILGQLLRMQMLRERISRQEQLHLALDQQNQSFQHALLDNRIHQMAGISTERNPPYNEVPSNMFEYSHPGRSQRSTQDDIDASNLSLQDTIRKAVLVGAMIGYMSKRN